MRTILKELDAENIDTLLEVIKLESADNEIRQEKNSYHLIFPNIIFEDQKHFNDFTRHVCNKQHPEELDDIFNTDLI